MGRKDDYQFEYLDDNTRFADQINGALFNGKQVVRPEELEPEDSRIVSTESIDGSSEQEIKNGNRKGRKKKKESINVGVDKVRTWKGRKLHILVVENQNYVDYQMVLRNMLSESIGYRKQWKQKKRLHTAANSLNKDEYLSGIRIDEKFIPIITLVVYFGDEHKWNGAWCLYDLLDIDDELKEYVTNYRLNLYDCQEHDTFDEYRTGLRQVFEAVRYSKDKEGLKKVMEENREAYSSIDSETRDMLEVVANVRIPDKFKTEENGEERYNMCKAFEDMRLEGYEAGRADGMVTGRAEGIAAERTEGIRILVQTCQELGVSKETIIQKCAEKFGIELESAGMYAEEYCV